MDTTFRGLRLESGGEVTELFDAELRPMFRGSDPETSADAAAMAHGAMSAHRQLAARALLSAGPDGLTEFELAELTGVAQTSIGKRRHDLCRAGLAVALLGPDGRQIRRPAPSGAAAGVYVHATYERPAQ